MKKTKKNRVPETHRPLSPISTAVLAVMESKNIRTSTDLCRELADLGWHKTVHNWMGVITRLRAHGLVTEKGYRVTPAGKLALGKNLATFEQLLLVCGWKV